MTATCVVTGGARGIGRAIAELLIDRGYAVVVTDIDEEAVKATAAALGAVGLEHDVRDPQAHRRVAHRAAREGRVVGWFNNAGVGHDGALAELTDEAVDRLVDINLKGVLWGSRAALEVIGPKGGDIVNTASLSGLGPVPGLSTYAATKAAVVSLTMSLDAETPPALRVHAVCPDGVDTDMVSAMSDAGLAKALVHSGGRLLRTEEVAEAAVGLLGSRRVLRTMPPWRGGLMRGTAVLPRLASRGVGVFASQGRRSMRSAGS